MRAGNSCFVALDGYSNRMPALYNNNFHPAILFHPFIPIAK